MWNLVSQIKNQIFFFKKKHVYRRHLICISNHTTHTHTLAHKVGSYYHGTNWYASSIMTAAQPWSGNYELNPVIWATAHVTQFTKIGWLYLKDGSGSGQLPNGGFYATFVDPSSKDFTLTVVKISYDHAECVRPSLPPFNVSDEVVTFKLAGSMQAPSTLAVWYSNYENFTAEAPIFVQLPDITVASDGTFSLKVSVGSFYTVSTVRSAQKGSHGTPPPSQPQFPLDYADDFQAYPESQVGCEKEN